MTTDYSEWIEQIRAAAHQDAATVLGEHGFCNDDGKWRGLLDLSSGEAVEVLVTVPEEFPDAVPSVALAKPESVKQRAHIEDSGKICLVPTSGVLLDTSRPRQIVTDALKRAQEALELSAEDEAAAVEEEFAAYWRQPKVDVAAYSTVDTNTETGPIVVTEFGEKKASILFCNNETELQKWASTLGICEVRARPALFIRFERTLEIPPFEDEMLLRDFFGAVEARTSATDQALIQNWIHENRLPCWALLLVPISAVEDTAVVAVQLPAPSAERAASSSRGFLRDKSALQKATAGFRPGKAPGSRLLTFARDQPLKRISVTRMDKEYLVKRGGGAPALDEKRVVLVGCGAIGSFAAKSLAGSGVGTLTLIDRDRLEPGNTYRHALGMNHACELKVDVIAKELRLAYPHVSFQTRAETIEQVLRSDPQVVADADLCVIAIGEETTERRLNEYLFQLPVRRIHAWLEPLGIGGHVLTTAPFEKPGCLECLYVEDDAYGIRNRASLLEPNQEFQRAIGGCAGTFTPFGAIDATEAGYRASRASLRVLLEPECCGALTSWCVSHDVATQANLKLSARGRLVPPGSTVVEEGFADAGCPVCSS